MDINADKKILTPNQANQPAKTHFLSDTNFIDEINELKDSISAETLPETIPEQDITEQPKVDSLLSSVVNEFQLKNNNFKIIKNDDTKTIKTEPENNVTVTDTSQITKSENGIIITNIPKISEQQIDVINENISKTNEPQINKVTEKIMEPITEKISEATEQQKNIINKTAQEIITPEKDIIDEQILTKTVQTKDTKPQIAETHKPEIQPVKTEQIALTEIETQPSDKSELAISEITKEQKPAKAEQLVLNFSEAAEITDEIPQIKEEIAIIDTIEPNETDIIKNSEPVNVINEIKQDIIAETEEVSDIILPKASIEEDTEPLPSIKIQYKAKNDEPELSKQVQNDSIVENARNITKDEKIDIQFISNIEPKIAKSEPVHIEPEILKQVQNDSIVENARNITKDEKIDIQFVSNKEPKIAKSEPVHIEPEILKQVQDDNLVLNSESQDITPNTIKIEKITSIIEQNTSNLNNSNISENFVSESIGEKSVILPKKRTIQKTEIKGIQDIKVPKEETIIPEIKAKTDILPEIIENNAQIIQPKIAENILIAEEPEINIKNEIQIGKTEILPETTLNKEPESEPVHKEPEILKQVQDDKFVLNSESQDKSKIMKQVQDDKFVLNSESQDKSKIMKQVQDDSARQEIIKDIDISEKDEISVKTQPQTEKDIPVTFIEKTVQPTEIHEDQSIEIKQPIMVEPKKQKSEILKQVQNDSAKQEIIKDISFDLKDGTSVKEQPKNEKIVKSEIKSEVKSEIISEARPEIKHETKDELKLQPINNPIKEPVSEEKNTIISEPKTEIIKNEITDPASENTQIQVVKSVISPIAEKKDKIEQRQISEPKTKIKISEVKNTVQNEEPEQKPEIKTPDVKNTAQNEEPEHEPEIKTTEVKSTAQHDEPEQKTLQEIINPVKNQITEEITQINITEEKALEKPEKIIKNKPEHNILQKEDNQFNQVNMTLKPTDKRTEKEETVSENNIINTQPIKEEVKPQVQTNLSFGTGQESFESILGKTNEIKESDKELEEDLAVLSTDEENIAIAAANNATLQPVSGAIQVTDPNLKLASGVDPMSQLIADTNKQMQISRKILQRVETKTNFKPDNEVTYSEVVTETEEFVSNDKPFTETKTETHVEHKTVTKEKVVKVKPEAMPQKDVNFMISLTKAESIDLADTLLNQTQETTQNSDISNKLIELIKKAMSENKPLRLDFDNKISVIIKISKEGKISADFIPGDKAVENYLRNNIPLLKQQFEAQNIKYDDITHQNSKQQKDKDNTKNKKEQKNE